MEMTMTRARWWSVCILFSMACADPVVLGENDCDGALTCTSTSVLYEPHIPVTAGADGGTSAPEPIEIRAAPAPATWTVPLSPLPEGLLGIVPIFEIASAPDGDVWVGQMNDPERFLVRLDAAGKELVAVPRPPLPGWTSTSMSLEVSSSLEPMLNWREVKYGKDAAPGSTTYQLQAGTVLTPIQTPLADLHPAAVIPGPNGGLRAVTFSASNAATLHEFDPSGAKLWSRTVDVPAQYQLAWGLAERLILPNLVRTNAGSTLLVQPVKDPLGYLDSGLLSLVDARGELRWHMLLARNEQLQVRIEPLQTDGFAVAIGTAGGFFIHHIKEDGTSHKSWQFEQSGYFGSLPDALASDAQGNLFFALTIGSRRQPAAVVCKLATSSPDSPLRCLALDTRSAANARIVDIASPSADAVVVVYGTAGKSSALALEPFAWSAARLDF